MSTYFTITKLSDLTISIAVDGVCTLSYPGQTDIINSASCYYKWYTYGVLGSTTNPLTFVSVSVSPPSGLKCNNYVNNSSLSLGLGTNSSGKYAIVGNGDQRPTAAMTAISICVDNQSSGSSGPFANYMIYYATGSGAAATVTLYHP